MTLGGPAPRGRSVAAARGAACGLPPGTPPSPSAVHQIPSPSGGSGARGTRTSQRTTQLGVADSRVFHFHTTQERRKKCKGGGAQPAFFRSVKAVSVSGTATCHVRLPCSSTPPAPPRTPPPPRAADRSPSGACPAPPSVRTGPSHRGPTRPSCRPPLRGAYKSRHQTGAALFSPHVLLRPVGSHRIPTNRATGTRGPAPRSPGSCRFTAAGGWFGNLSSLRSCRLISVSRSLPLSVSHRPADAPPPPPPTQPSLSFLFQERDLHGVSDGRTSPLRSSRAVRRKGGRASGSPADWVISSVGAKKQLLRVILGPAENIFRGQRNLTRVA